jgi:hypothetical protein
VFSFFADRSHTGNNGLEGLYLTNAERRRDRGRGDLVVHGIWGKNILACIFVLHVRERVCIPLMFYSKMKIKA